MLLNVETTQITEPDRRHDQDLDCNRKLRLERAAPKIAISAGDVDQLLWQAEQLNNIRMIIKLPQELSIFFGEPAGAGAQSL